jgi:hypothetical protein
VLIVGDVNVKNEKEKDREEDLKCKYSRKVFTMAE